MSKCHSWGNKIKFGIFPLILAVFCFVVLTSGQGFAENSGSSAPVQFRVCPGEAISRQKMCMECPGCGCRVFVAYYKGIEDGKVKIVTDVGTSLEPFLLPLDKDNRTHLNMGSYDATYSLLLGADGCISVAKTAYRKEYPDIWNRQKQKAVVE